MLLLAAAAGDASRSNDLIRLFGRTKLMDAGSPGGATEAAPGMGHGERRSKAAAAQQEPPGRPPALLAPSFFKQPPPGAPLAQATVEGTVSGVGHRTHADVEGLLHQSASTP